MSESTLIESPLNTHSKPISFHLTQDQTDKFASWSKGRIGQGPIGGRITVSFTGTSIGVVVMAKDESSGEELDLSDYENW